MEGEVLSREIGGWNVDGVLHYLTHPKWGYGFLILGLVAIFEFGEGNISPLPWVAFSVGYEQHGLVEAFNSLLLVTTADLWFFWTIGQVELNETKVKNDGEVGARLRTFIRTANLFLGAALVTPENPIYILVRICLVGLENFPGP